MKTGKLIISLLLSASMLAGCGSSQAAAASSAPAETTAAVETTVAAEDTGSVTITDHAGRTVTVPTNPKKVVVADIYPLASVLTVYLNSCDSIIAMEPTSMSAAKNGVLSQLYPDIVNIDTEILNGDDLNVEAVAALEPDIVYYNAGNSSEAEMLENAGLTAVGFSPTKFNYDCIETFNQWIALLDQIYPGTAGSRTTLASDTATKVYDEVSSRVQDLADDQKQTVLFLFQYDDTKMVTSGSNFFGQWWCDAVGALNVANEIPAENKNAAITMEQVYAWDPDVIILTNFTPTKPEDLYNNAVGSDDWSSVKAVKDKRVYKMPMGTYRSYTPSVDTPMVLEWLAQVVYPDLFSDYDIDADVKAYYQDVFGVSLSDDQIAVMYPSTATGN